MEVPTQSLVPLPNVVRMLPLVKKMNVGKNPLGQVRIPHQRRCQRGHQLHSRHLDQHLSQLRKRRRRNGVVRDLNLRRKTGEGRIRIRWMILMNCSSRWFQVRNVLLEKNKGTLWMVKESVLQGCGCWSKLVVLWTLWPIKKRERGGLIGVWMLT